jgi:hypothetical protein
MMSVQDTQVQYKVQNRTRMSSTKLVKNAEESKEKAVSKLSEQVKNKIRLDNNIILFLINNFWQFIKKNLKKNYMNDYVII